MLRYRAGPLRRGVQHRREEKPPAARALGEQMVKREAVGREGLIQGGRHGHAAAKAFGGVPVATTMLPGQ